MSIDNGVIKQLAKLGLLLMITASAQAASFDCKKAQSKVEHLICDNPEISKLDEELSVAYKAALQAKQQAVDIKQAQKQWMKERNDCADAACVKTAYQNHLLVLQQTKFSDTQSDVADNAHRQNISTPLYELLQEEPYEPLSEICEEFTAMLNAFGPEEPQMRCEQKLHPAFPKFKSIELQALPEKDNFKYFTAIDDLAIRDIIRRGYTGPLRTKADQKRLFEEKERLGGYRYYLFTTDRFIRNKTITMLVQERQGDCRIKHASMDSARRIAYEWDAKTESVVKRLFFFQSIFTYEGKSMQGDGLLVSNWNEAELPTPSGKSGGIWVKQSDNLFGVTSPICYIVYNDKQ